MLLVARPDRATKVPPQGKPKSLTAFWGFAASIRVSAAGPNSEADLKNVVDYIVAYRASESAAA